MKNRGRVMLVIAATVVGTWGLRNVGTHRQSLCEGISSRADLAAISDVLGAPVASHVRDGLIVLGFEPDSAASGNIHVVIESRSNRVLSLSCRYGQPATWEVKR